MERMSSSMTFIMKRVFPVFWFGFIMLFMGIGLTQGAGGERWMFVIQPLVMAAFGYVLFRKLLWDLADDVRDGGAHLLVSKGGVEERVALSNVINIDCTRWVNPQRVTLRLRTPGKLGAEIAFIPKTAFQLNPFARHPVAESLIVRADKARQGADR